VRPAGVFTLVIADTVACLLDDRGKRLVSLPREPAQWGPRLQQHLPRGASVQLVLMGARVEVATQEVPALSRREAQEVTARLAGQSREPRRLGQTLDGDPRAEGGHVLWTASVLRIDMDAWLKALDAAQARLLFAVPWQRALLMEAARPDEPDTLILTLEPGAGRLLQFQGRALRCVRAFATPVAREEGAALVAVVASELGRLLQFVRQRHRGTAPITLRVAGLPEALAPALTAMAQAQGLGLSPVGSDLAVCLKAGADRERRRRGGLDLRPIEIREARQRRVYRRVVWSAASAILCLGLAGKIFFLRQEAALVHEALRAEADLDHRRILAREGEAAARLRFGWLRLRWAEHRVALAATRLEALGLSLLKVPAGVELGGVEVLQAPGEEVSHHFTVQGSAHSRKNFSVGRVASYLAQVAAHPGLKLEPLKEVAVADGAKGALDHAQARFQFEGTSP
jgi:hypothetical protein